jgi:hypothetical protein
MERIYRAHVSVTVPLKHPSGRIIWRPAPEFPTGVVEFVRSPEECGTLILRYGNIVGANRMRHMTYTSFRVSATGVTTGLLCALGEWTRRNRSEAFENAFEWHAEWSDVPASARHTALYDPLSAA